MALKEVSFPLVNESEGRVVLLLTVRDVRAVKAEPSKEVRRLVERLRLVSVVNHVPTKDVSLLPLRSRVLNALYPTVPSKVVRRPPVSVKDVMRGRLLPVKVVSFGQLI